jgi:hypothetical protein
VIHGLDHSAGDAVVIMMADESDDCRDVVRYWQVLCEGYDCAFGSRFMAGGGLIDYGTRFHDVSGIPVITIAVLAVFLFCVSMGVVFKRVSRRGRTRFHKKTIEIAGIGSMVYAFLVVTEKKLPKDIPGDLYETGQFKDACEFLKVSPTKNVWVTIIGGVCEDAQLRKRGEEGNIVSPPTIMAGDATYGQAGWDIGIKYGTGTFNSLPQLLTSRCKGFLLGKLAINAHGDPGGNRSPPVTGRIAIASRSARRSCAEPSPT